MVGLGNVDNTSDSNKPVSTAQQSAIDLKSNIASPTFTGIVSMPTLNVSQTVFISGDVSMNQKLFVASDVSMNQKLFVGSDISLNGKVFIGGSLITRFQLIDNNDYFINNNNNNYLNINNGNHFWISSNFGSSFYLPNQIPPDGFFLYFRKLNGNATNIINLDTNYGSNIYDITNTSSTSYGFTSNQLKIYYSSYDTSWYVSN